MVDSIQPSFLWQISDGDSASDAQWQITLGDDELGEGEFLKTSELTQTRAFVHSFVKEIEVKPGKAAIVYSIPTPDDSPIGGADSAEIALTGRVRSSVRDGGQCRTRTCGLLRVKQAL